MTIKEFILGQTVYAQDSSIITPEACKKQFWVYFFKEVSNNQCICSNMTSPDWPCIIKEISDITNKNQANCETTTKFSTRSKDTWLCDCPNGKTDDGTECLINNAGTLGINCSAEQLINNTCSRDINKTLGIRQSDTTSSPTILLQDITLAATSFVGTLIMIALLYLGVKAVMAWWSDADALGDIKTQGKNLGIWFWLVIISYSAIKIIQYVARGY